MISKLVLIALVLTLFSGCASIPMEGVERTADAKKFAPPAAGYSGLYIYRIGLYGGALRKDIWIDGKCIGQSVMDVFFYEEVEGDKEHIVSTESEFSPNDLIVNTESGMHYFIRQYIKTGIFVGGAGLELVGEAEGKAAVSKLNMAAKSACSK